MNKKMMTGLYVIRNIFVCTIIYLCMSYLFSNITKFTYSERFLLIKYCILVGLEIHDFIIKFTPIYDIAAEKFIHIKNMEGIGDWKILSCLSVSFLMTMCDIINYRIDGKINPLQSLFHGYIYSCLLVVTILYYNIITTCLYCYLSIYLPYIGKKIWQMIWFVMKNFILPTVMLFGTIAFYPAFKLFEYLLYLL